MRGVWLALIFVGLAATVAVFSHPLSDWHWNLPDGVAPPPVPKDNPMSAAKVELGRRLFYDADLSVDGTTSCGTCHEQHRGFTEGNRTHGGVGGTPGRRNVMPLANVAYFSPLTWADSSQHRLEKQAMVPLMGLHPVEMGMMGHDAELARRLAADSCYQQMFVAAFRDGQINTERVTMAIAAFERTLISFDSPYDRFRRGDIDAISDQAKSGAKIFEKTCASCHAGPNFTDGKYHNIGLNKRNAISVMDHGLREATGIPQDEGMFRTPSLRNIVLTGPYMHDGSVSNLTDAIRGHASPSGVGHTLSDRDLSRVLAFLQLLSDRTFVTNPNFSLPKSARGKPL